MFSQACVKNSVHGGGGGWGRCTLPAQKLPPPLNQTATAADGMHPTGMHSCFILHSELQNYRELQTVSKNEKNVGGNFS